MPPAPSSTCTRTEFLHLGVKAFTAAALLSAFPAGTASAATSATAPTTNPTYDLTHFVRWITEEFEPMFRLPGPAGSYAREPGATVTELYGVADMACILYTIGHLHPTEAERTQWIANLQSFQNPDTGYLVEKKPTHAPLHNTAFLRLRPSNCSCRPVASAEIRRRLPGHPHISSDEVGLEETRLR